MRTAPMPRWPSGAAPGAPIVLVADDDDELRALLVYRLRRLGCDVREAGTGVALIELVIEHQAAADEPPLALVVSDVRMPGRSGLDVVRLLRRAGCEVPVLLITGFGSAELHAAAAALGAVVCDKPIDLDELAARSAALMRGAR